MQTYSHAFLSYGLARRLHPDSRRNPALAAGIGAILPDIPIALGAVWLWTKRGRFSRADFDEKVCGRSLFREPDAALHSAIPIAAALALEKIVHPRRDAPAGGLRAKESTPPGDAPTARLYKGSEEMGVPAYFASAFLLGWAGHIFADFLTHGKDARPILWPISEWKFESPISYREKERHGTIFTLVEHAALAISILAVAKRNP